MAARPRPAGVPGLAPAPWSPSSPPTANGRAGVPVQPPFGVTDPPATSAPASAPLHSFGGASAGSATPAPTRRAHVTARRRADAGVAAARVRRPRSTRRSAKRRLAVLRRDRLPGRARGVAGLPSPASVRALPGPCRAARACGGESPAAAPQRPPPPLSRRTPASATAPPRPPAISPRLADAGSGVRAFDAASLRSDFPILQERFTAGG